MFKTHLVIGFFVALLMLEFFVIEMPILFVFFVVLASIIPDADFTKSKVGKKMGPIAWTLNFLFGHRGVIHSIFIPIILYFVILVVGLGEVVAMGVFIGYLAHLFSDALTKEGVRFLNPIVFTKISGPIRTGGVFDYLLFFAFIVLDILLLV